MTCFQHHATSLPLTMKLTVLGALSALAASSLAFTVPAQCTLDCVLLSAFNEKCNDAKTNGCFDFCKVRLK